MAKQPKNFAPVQMKNKAVGYMSALHLDPDKKPQPFQDPGAPEDFKADAPGVTGTVRKVSSEPIKFGDHGYGISYPTVRDIEGKEIKGAGRKLTRIMEKENPAAKHIKYKGAIPSEKIGKTYLKVTVDK